MRGRRRRSRVRRMRRRNSSRSRRMRRRGGEDKQGVVKWRTKECYATWSGTTILTLRTENEKYSRGRKTKDAIDDGPPKLVYGQQRQQNAPSLSVLRSKANKPERTNKRTTSQRATT